jgi:hypothetical protein
LVQVSSELRTASWPCWKNWVYCAVSIVIVCLPASCVVAELA